MRVPQKVGVMDSKWPITWVACNSSRADLHAYPCSLWLLFHTLIAHSSEPTALTTLHAVVGYVTTFFSCSECASHFRQLASHLDADVRKSKLKGGRDRAMLWLWEAHNKVCRELVGRPHSLWAPCVRGDRVRGWRERCVGMRRATRLQARCSLRAPPLTIPKDAGQPT